MLDDIPEHQAQGKPGWDEIALLLAYCAHQTLGNVPCPRKPVVSPIWALVPRFRPLVAFICQAEIYQNGYVGSLKQSSAFFGA